GGIVATGTTSILHDLEPASFSQVADKADLGKWAFNDQGAVGNAMAMVTVLVAATGPRWRKVFWTALALVILARLISSSVLPATAFFEMALGWAIGSAILLVFKAPNPRPTAADVAASLERAGLPVRSLRVPAVD